MLGGLLDSFLKLSNPAPRYTGPRCLVERYAVGGCSACADVCPHDAITLEGSVTISEVNCTGCGLCTQVCPSGALEYDVEAPLYALRAQGDLARLACSQAGSDAPSVTCLGRITPSALTVAGAWGKQVVLEHGDCAHCPIGSPDVPAHLEDVVDEARKLRAPTEKPLHARIVQTDAGQPGANLGPRVSRRGALGSLFGSARRVVADLIPERPLPFVDWSNPEEHVPADYLWRRKALKPVPDPDTAVYWPAPVVDEGCILCPVCTNVCPTEAVNREMQPDGSFKLYLDASSCTACNACVTSCPPQVMRLEPIRPFSELEALVLMYETPEEKPVGS
ncbi:ferredoxin [Deinobacterium chartae]|uniref:Ferredoxin n=1 Tax=Deinobacterium chartae TaxID=521158 RepID=A0A841I1S7_9DEIO|nr:4Fe-4S dicluster domain-containing protein [Deinobacterium chartae]MBB6099771.1 ferredoxin [Deinobacterium chartae]